MIFTALIRTLLERIGLANTPTERTAKARMESGLEGKEVVGRRRVKLPGQDKAAFVATVKPYPETISSPSPEQLAAVKENAALIEPFLRGYSNYTGGSWGLAELDKAFEGWITSGEKAPYDDEAVVQIAGAAFGEYCAQHLNMEWVLVDDADGQVLGIIGVEKNFKGFPHVTVRKRIPVHEHGFFEPGLLPVS